MSDPIDDRLHNWARWAISGRPQLGISDRTLLYEMVRSGVIAHGIGKKPEPEAREEEETDRAIQKLSEARPREYQAIALQYLGKGLPWQKAKDLGVTQSVYFKLIRVGKYWLEGYFEANVSSHYQY